mgnify:FL=1
MKPIAQTFYVNQPGTGIPGVYVTKVDLYFKSVSSVYGIELQIRTTDNGVPTIERLPFASKFLFPTDVNPPVASDNASVATTFEFDTPVFLQAGLSYALVLIPVGGNPDYQVWTAEIGQTDALNNVPIYTNNETGDLFLSSNDRSWIPVITEDMKFTIYTAEFTSLTGTAIFRSPNEDYAELKDIVGTFLTGEPLYVTGNVYNNAKLTVTSINGTFSSGDYVYQSNGTGNTAYGYVYAANSTTIRLQNTTAAFVTSNTLYNATVSANAYVTAVSQNASITQNANTFTVPDNTIFSVNDMIYIATNNYSQAQLLTVKTVNGDGVTLGLSNATLNGTNTSLFTDTNCIYGKVLHNGTTLGALGALQVFPDFTRIIIDNVTSTTSNNFVDGIGQRLIGLFSHASANIHNVIDAPYNQISPQITHISPANTDISWAFKGFRNNQTFTEDSSYIPINEGLSNELIDYERVIMSRSNELTNLPGGRIGDRSVKIQASLSSANTKVSPVIDVLSKYSHFTYNYCVPDYELTGYYLTLSNTQGQFSNGDSVVQGSSNAVIRFANSTFARITDITNFFNANNTTLMVASNNSVNATITSAEFYTENFDNGYYGSSRYISKNVILASGQSSEDILVFLGAYRPAVTNLRVYAKIINAQDSDQFNDKDWSSLVETSSSSLISSQVNKDDLVELVYAFPQSLNITPNNSVCNTSSNVISISSPYSSSDLRVGNFIYVSDDTNKKFNIRRIVNIPNTTAVIVDKIPSFTSSNVAFGYIPGMFSSASAFLNDQNNNIVRYVTNSDLVYDNYSQFAMKIVPVSTTTSIVPRVGDMRVLALQA